MGHSSILRGLAEVSRDSLLPADFDIDLVEEFFASSSKAPGKPAISFLEAADEKAAADLNDLVPVLESTDEDTPTDSGSELDLDGVRPDGKGGGKSGDGGGGGTKGGGKGKNKDTTGDGTDTDGSTTDGSTDGGTTGDGTTGGTTGDGTTGDTGGGYTTGNYVSGLDTPDGFNIEIEFSGAWTDAMKQVLYDVTEEISDIIVGDLPSYNGIDDFKLLANASEIDGAGGWLGLGGAVTKRAGTYLPAEGLLRVDTADAQTEMDLGTFGDVLFHEVVHSLGFGSIWDDLGLVEIIDGAPRFVGENAVAAYNALFPDQAASDPYSDQGILLAADESHWHHGTFTHEMMTTSLYYSGNYVSDMTIAALEDMGYDTVFNIGDLPIA